jgi:hypothetical protein
MTRTLGSVVTLGELALSFSSATAFLSLRFFFRVELIILRFLTFNRWWLYRHQEYITSAGHVECKDDLAAYEATLRKRATHGGMARKLRKRAEEGIYAM